MGERLSICSTLNKGGTWNSSASNAQASQESQSVTPIYQVAVPQAPEYAKAPFLSHHKIKRPLLSEVSAKGRRILKTPYDQ
ncbi:hypothetical protein HI914_05952 [Erysiphe necator]|nr:hypothetical protein HI914_05952 [Erysiphe necator]